MYRRAEKPIEKMETFQMYTPRLCTTEPLTKLCEMGRTMLKAMKLSDDLIVRAEDRNSIQLNTTPGVNRSKLLRGALDDILVRMIFDWR